MPDEKLESAITLDEPLSSSNFNVNHIAEERRKEDQLTRWQNKLVPWMVIMPTILMMAFIILATLRMSKFETFIYSNQESLLDKKLPKPDTVNVESITSAQLDYIKFYTFAQMEQYSINKRYNQAGAITMSTIYTKYLGFFTGMILTIVGSVFIVSKLKEDASNVEGSFSKQVRFKLLSSSPGIIFGVLGTVLMTITIVKKGEVKVDDAPLFLNHLNLYKPVEYLNDNKIDSNNINDLPTDSNGHISPKEAEGIDLNK